MVSWPRHPNAVRLSDAFLARAHSNVKVAFTSLFARDRTPLCSHAFTLYFPPLSALFLKQTALIKTRKTRGELRVIST